jgi:hypothetical protein
VSYRKIYSVTYSAFIKFQVIVTPEIATYLGVAGGVGPLPAFVAAAGRTKPAAVLGVRGSVALVTPGASTSPVEEPVVAWVSSAKGDEGGHDND